MLAVWEAALDKEFEKPKLLTPFVLKQNTKQNKFPWTLFQSKEFPAFKRDIRHAICVKKIIQDIFFPKGKIIVWLRKY